MSPESSPAHSAGSDDDVENRTFQHSTDTEAVAPADSQHARQPLSRRGHFKSRMGCFNCKRRRVKCNELRPQCSPCRRLALDCTYPPTPAGQSMRPSPSVFSLEDLRFYNHFLMTSIPPLPVYADDYEFLAHAAIGLGASHLTRHSNGEYHSQALHHRLKAIKHVNERLSNPPKEQSVRDALFAALLCIISQSSLIEDGLVDYMTLSRGGHLLLHVVQGSKLENSLFCKFTAEGHVKAAMEVVREDQRQDFSDMDGFNASVQALAPLIQAPQDQLYYGALAAIYPALMQSSLNAWVAFSTIFVMPAAMNSELFIELVNPENYVSRLMIIHVFLVDYALAQICLPPGTKTRTPKRKDVIIGWARNASAGMPARYKPYTAWVDSFCEKLEKSEDCRHLFTP